MLEAVDLAEDAVRQVGAGLRGSVALGVMQAQAMQALSIPRLLAGFRDDHPGVEVSVRHVGGSSQMAHDVREGQLDLAVARAAGVGARTGSRSPGWRSRTSSSPAPPITRWRAGARSTSPRSPTRPSSTSRPAGAPASSPTWRSPPAASATR